MGYLYLNQLHREYGSLWLARVYNEKTDLRLYTKDNKISIGPNKVVAAAFEPDVRKMYTLEGLFKAYGKVAHRGANYIKLLSTQEAKQLFRDPTSPGSWPVWGVTFNLNPTVRVDG